jgi:hypothetical protein
MDYLPRKGLATVAAAARCSNFTDGEVNRPSSGIAERSADNRLLS